MTPDLPTPSEVKKRLRTLIRQDLRRLREDVVDEPEMPPLDLLALPEESDA